MKFCVTLILAYSSGSFEQMYVTCGLAYFYMNTTNSKPRLVPGMRQYRCHTLNLREVGGYTLHILETGQSFLC